MTPEQKMVWATAFALAVSHGLDLKDASHRAALTVSVMMRDSFDPPSDVVRLAMLQCMQAQL